MCCPLRVRRLCLCYIIHPAAATEAMDIILVYCGIKRLFPYPPDGGALPGSRGETRVHDGRRAERGEQGGELYH